MDGNEKKRDNTQPTEKIQPISVGELLRMEGNTPVEHPSFRSSFLEKLEVRRQELEDALRGLNVSEDAYRGMLSSDDFIELLDHAEREMSNQIRYSLLERKKEELVKIQQLLSSVLNNEEFGICEDCGRRIPEERLLIVPEATRCVRCQSETEKRNSRKRLLERSRSSNRNKTRLEPEHDEESNAHKISFKIEREHLSLTDMEEAVLEYDQNSNDP